MKSIINRIFCIYNFIPFLVVPVVIWGYDFTAHLLLQPVLSSKLWLVIITLTMPICGYLTVFQIYKGLKMHIEEMLPPEITGLIGFLYAQPVYMILSKIASEGIKSISFVEAIKTIVVLTPIVPISTVMISTYDGTLLAVPLTCLSIILVGVKYRRGQ